MAVFWDVAPCSVVDTNQHFGDTSSIIITLIAEAVSSSETFAHIYQTTRNNMPEAGLSNI
jgi:hypothetical protein